MGIDLGIKDLATLSDATVYENHKFLSKKEKRLKRYQRMMSRQKGSKKGEKKSNRYKKTQRKFRKLERKISNARKDNLEKVTTEICKTYKNIAIEDLKVKNMQSKHQFAKSLSDVSFATFRGCLERKARKFNNKIFIIDTFYPSSKTCCNCGQVRAKFDLNERIYKCEHCSVAIQRDLNAAINLEKVARRTQETQNAHGEFVKKIPLKEISINSKKCESGSLNHLINIRPEVLGGNAKTLQDVM